MIFPLFQASRTRVSNGAQIFDYSYVVDILREEAHITTFWQILVVAIILGWGFLRTVKITNQYKIRAKSLYFLLYAYHMGITLVYYYLTKNSMIFADARSYYFKAIKPDLISAFEIKFSFGTSFVVLITDFLVNSLGFNYLCCTLLFSLLGYYGILYFLKICHDLGFAKSAKYLGIYLIPTVFFLPNIHFWTSALGKDSLVFYAIMAFTYSLMRLTKRWVLTIFSAFIFVMLRPHIFIMALAALMITIVLFKKMNLILKSIIVVVGGGAGLVFADLFIRTRLGGSGLSLSSIVEILDNQQGYYVGKSYSRTSLDLSGFPLPFKMFTYLYRPLFERFSFNFLLLSVENAFMLLISLQLFTRRFCRYFVKSDFVVKYCLFYVILGTAVMGTAMSNFGIATRQKTMFLYCLLVVIFSFMAHKEQARRILNPR